MANRRREPFVAGAGGIAASLGRLSAGGVGGRSSWRASIPRPEEVSERFRELSPTLSALRDRLNKEGVEAAGENCLCGDFLVRAVAWIDWRDLASLQIRDFSDVLREIANYNARQRRQRRQADVREPAAEEEEEEEETKDERRRRRPREQKVEADDASAGADLSAAVAAVAANMGGMGGMGGTGGMGGMGNTGQRSSAARGSENVSEILRDLLGGEAKGMPARIRIKSLNVELGRLENRAKTAFRALSEAKSRAIPPSPEAAQAFDLVEKKLQRIIASIDEMDAAVADAVMESLKPERLRFLQEGLAPFFKELVDAHTSVESAKSVTEQLEQNQNRYQRIGRDIVAVASAANKTGPQDYVAMFEKMENLILGMWGRDAGAPIDRPQEGEEEEKEEEQVQFDASLIGQGDGEGAAGRGDLDLAFGSAQVPLRSRLAPPSLPAPPLPPSAEIILQRQLSDIERRFGITIREYTPESPFARGLTDEQVQEVIESWYGLCGQDEKYDRAIERLEAAEERRDNKEILAARSALEDLYRTEPRAIVSFMTKDEMKSIMLCGGLPQGESKRWVQSSRDACPTGSEFAPYRLYAAYDENKARSPTPSDLRGFIVVKRGTPKQYQLTAGTTTTDIPDIDINRALDLRFLCARRMPGKSDVPVAELLFYHMLLAEKRLGNLQTGVFLDVARDLYRQPARTPYGFYRSLGFLPAFPTREFSNVAPINITGRGAKAAKADYRLMWLPTPNDDRLADKLVELANYPDTKAERVARIEDFGTRLRAPDAPRGRRR